jgi:hypothetical protein
MNRQRHRRARAARTARHHARAVLSRFHLLAQLRDTAPGYLLDALPAPVAATVRREWLRPAKENDR